MDYFALLLCAAQYKVVDWIFTSPYDIRSGLALILYYYYYLLELHFIADFIIYCTFHGLLGYIYYVSNFKYVCI